MELTESADHENVIFVNKKQLKVAEDSLTGQQILERAAYDPAQYDLFLVQGQKSEPVQPTEPVPIRNGLHFNAILKNVQYGGFDDS